MDSPKQQMYTQPKLTIEIDPPSGAFLTEVLDAPNVDTMRTQSQSSAIALSPRRLPTKFGLVGELDVIDGLLERMRAKTRKMNPESPRTKQALSNLGIAKEECVVKKFEHFEAHSRDEKMKKLLYIYYIGHVNDTISQVLKERDKIRRKKDRRLSMEMCPIGMPQTKTAVPDSAKSNRTTFAFMNMDRRLERLTDTKHKEICLIEKQTMDFLESERDYLRKNESMKERLEKAEKKKKALDDKKLEKLKDIKEKKQKYAESLETARRLVAQKEEEIFINANNHFRTRSVKDFKDIFAQDIRKTSMHKARELKAFEEQKKVKQRIEEREQDSMYRSALAFGQFLKKDAQSRMVLQKELDKKRAISEKWNNKVTKAREHVKSSNFENGLAMYTKYAEKMKRFQTDADKIEKERTKKLQERKKEKEEQLLKVKEKLGVIQRDLDLREELLEEKIMSQTERLETFYATRQHMWDQKVDLSNFKSQRSQIHFDKIKADEIHKSNIIMAKNRVWAEAIEKKKKDKDMLRNESMKNRWNVKGEKTSLNYYLDMVNKIHAPPDLVAGKLRNANTTLNVQHMANYITTNFNTQPAPINTDEME